jgi:hypothetical protein
MAGVGTIDCLVNPRLQGVEKLIWVLVIFFLHLLGAISPMRLRFTIRDLLWLGRW